MKTVPLLVPEQAGEVRAGLYRRARALALVTIFYNLLEGVVSVFFGLEDETIALFGFGLDSFVEVVSGIGIWHMVRRIRASGGDGVDLFEAVALRVTGTAFYLLAAGLSATAAVSALEGRKPETTFWGIVVSVISIATMWALIRMKTEVGTRLGSAAILADAACTRACLWLSVTLLVASAGYEITGLGYVDAAGAAAIALLSLREGREAFGKARGKSCRCGDGCRT